MSLFDSEVQQAIRDGNAEIEGPRRKPGTRLRLTLIQYDGQIYKAVTEEGRAK